MKDEVFEKELFSEADRIVSAADARGITLRLIGAIAIRLHSETARKDMSRDLTDLDFVGYGKERKKIDSMLQELGYDADWAFNTLHPSNIRFNIKASELHIDIWLDIFEMCHRFDFTHRLHLDKPTLPVTDLLMTKLQIVESNEKDVKDIFSLVLDHDLAENDEDTEHINVKYFQELCSKDWGIYKTFTTNIIKIMPMVDSYVLLEEQRALVKSRLTALLEDIEKTPKKMSWKLRAMVGEKQIWYETPEQLRHQRTV
jgi:hypothetical protein